MTDEFRWPDGGPAGLRDGLQPVEVIDALHSVASLRMDNRVPRSDPTLLAVSAPTAELRLIIVVCTRTPPDEIWTITGAREAGMNEREMWRKHTS